MSRLELCTYFDHRYLPRALALYRSLERHGGDFRLWALCLSPECEDLLRRLALPRLHAVPLADLERADPALAACRPSRTAVEYYFTCSPCFPRYLLARDPSIETIVYLDSDLYFFGDPRAVLQHLGDASVGLTPHRFSRRTPRKFHRCGKYNVGWLSFRRTPDGAACLAWWRERCIEWCHDRVEPDRYADQKYLERFEALFGGVRSIALPGANLAPWNVSGCRLEDRAEGVQVDGTPLLFFHFQGVSRVREGLYETNLGSYRASMTPLLRSRIYTPYLRELAACEHEVAALGVAPSRSLRRPKSLAGRLRHSAGLWVRGFLSLLYGTRVRVS